MPAGIHPSPLNNSTLLPVNGKDVEIDHMPVVPQPSRFRNLNQCGKSKIEVQV
jgi:hypothetical protein